LLESFLIPVPALRAVPDVLFDPSLPDSYDLLSFNAAPHATPNLSRRHNEQPVFFHSFITQINTRQCYFQSLVITESA